MSKKRADRQKSKRQRQSKHQPADIIAPLEKPNDKSWTRIFYFLFVALLVFTGATYAYLLTDIFESPKEIIIARTASTKADRRIKKDLPPDLDQPPENTPIDRGYNASSGQFPPGALPSGVNLPGIQSYNPAIQDRFVEQGYGVNDGVRQKFTGQIRDSEIGLDYFNARYYSSRHGRFTSVDPENAGADPSDPQSWNAYAYARNNPLKYVDPSGEEYLICDKDGKCWKHNDSDVRNAKTKGGFFFIGAKSPETGLDSGNIYDEDGNITATYRQISHDNPVQAMLWGAMPTLDIWQTPVELVQPAPIPGGGAAGAIVKGGSKASKAGKLGRAGMKGFRVIERAGDAIHVAVGTSKGEVQVVAIMAREGDTLILKRLDVQGAGANSLGIRELRGLEKAFAQEIGKHEGAKTVVIEGGKRQSGANPGRVPHPRTYQID